MVLETQRDNRSDAQRDNAGQQTDGPRQFDVAGSVVTALPFTSDDSCCSARFSRDEIAGSDRSREVSGLGQVTPEVSAGGECCVPAGCGCGPDGNASTIEIQGQAPFGVDSVDGTPADSVARERVDNSDSVVIDVESRSPEAGVQDHTEKAEHREPSNQSACCEGGQGCCQSNSEDSDGYTGKYPTGSGNERRHEIHAGTKADR